MRTLKTDPELKAQLQQLKLYLDIVKTVDEVCRETETMEPEEKAKVRKTFAPKIRTIVHRLGENF